VLAEALVSSRVLNQKGLVVQGVASQSANLQEWQNSAGSITLAVNSIWALFVGSGGASNPRLSTTDHNYKILRQAGMI